jgi:predicted ArsR family transcriptional regulator
VPEIAGQLYVSANTVQAHMRHLYQKLGAHRRSVAVEQARARPARIFRAKALAGRPVAAGVIPAH